jgi:hypothetical protein
VDGDSGGERSREFDKESVEQVRNKNMHLDNGFETRERDEDKREASDDYQDEERERERERAAGRARMSRSE